MFAWRLALMLAALVLAGGTLHAQAPTQEEQSRQHYAQGEAHYRAGRWVEALNEFDLAYSLSPRPEFLVNFAQVYRKLARYDRAIVQCERYLATAPPPSMAEEARRLLAAIREEQARASVRPLPPQPPKEPPPPVVVAPPPVVVAPPPPVVVAPVVEAPKPRRSRAWIWGVVAGGVVLAGGAVTLGVLLSSPGVSYPNEPLGRVSFPLTRRYYVLALCVAGCSTSGTGVALTVEGAGLSVDQLAIVASYGGRSVPRTIAVPAGVALPATVLAELAAERATITFDVTGLLKGAPVGHGISQAVDVEPHHIASTSVTLIGSVIPDMSVPDGADTDAGAVHPWMRQRGGVPPLATAALTAVWGSAPGDVYATSQASAGGNLLHSIDHGATWTGSTAGLGDLNGVWGFSSTDVYLAGAGALLLRGSGTSWSPQTTPAPSATALNAVWGAAPGDVYAVGSGSVILHQVTGGWVSQNAVGTTVLYAVWGSSTSDVYAVGSGGVILHSTGNGSWTPQSSGVTGDLHGVWGSGKTDVYVVGEGGTILHSTGSGTWTPQTSGLPTTIGLGGIWGFGANAIYAVGAGWTLLRSGGGGAWAPEPSGLTVDGVAASRFRGVWGNDGNDVYAVGAGQTIVHRQ